MSRSQLLCGAAILLVSAAAAGSANAKEQFTTFDPKGSIYTFASGINGSGAVAGYYEDTQGLTHGFMRTSDGTITTFDPKGATYTEATGINDKGEIAGWYRDESNAYFSFVRAADGSITKFNATKGYEPNTVGLNAKGNVTGSYTMGNETAGFVGKPEGKIRQLSVEGVAINTKGAVTGTDGSEGFVRSASGKMESFQGPGDPSVTVPTSINSSGTVAGYGETVCGIEAHGFSRSANGSFTTVDPENSSYTHVQGISDKGAMTGTYYYGGYHGFVRNAGGSFTTFDITGDTYGTYPQAINTKGLVAGGYRDGNDVLHGFVGSP